MNIIRMFAGMVLLGCAAHASAVQNSSGNILADGDQSTQPSASANQPKKLDTITVTGTHIRSIDIENQHPLLVLTRMDLDRTGLTDIAEIVQGLIINGQTQNRNINNGTDGRELVNLRSLGPNRTLVLVNGQRWVSGLDGAVDLSAIPLALIERVDVLKDGASAIYGSDAIAGVINIITRRDFHGAELGSYFGETDHGDGQRRDVNFSFGRSGERWAASFGIEYAKDDPVSAGDRAISSVPFAGLPPAATGIAYLMFRYHGPYTLIPGRPGTSPDDFRRVNFATDLNFNYAPYNYLQTPMQRKAVFAQAHYEFTPTLKLLADVLFNRRQSVQQLAPPRLSFGSFCCGGTPAGFDISADSIYNPLGVAITAVGRRVTEDPARRWRQRVDTTREHVGLDGLLEISGRSVEWGADILHTRARQDELISPFQNNAKLALAVGPSFYDANGVAHCGTPDAPIEQCVPFDVLGPQGSVTREMLDYVDVQASNRMRSDDVDINAHATSALFDLPAGPLNAAAGLEYRRESGRDDPDPLLAMGLANGGGINYRPTTGAYSVKEAFAEFEIPLLAEHPFARQLTVNVASRWSDYSLFGATTNSQFALRWKPADDLLVRASYLQGFRAPSVVDLFEGSVATGEAADDPCAASSHPTTTTLARCAALGVPADVENFGGTAVTFGGNRALRPEKSRTRNLGLVYSPSSLPALTATLDWYRIQINDAIGERSAQAILDACYKLGDENACALISRDSGSGLLHHIDASQQNIPGGLESEGYDLTVQWQRDTPVGHIQWLWDNAYVAYYGELGQPAPGTILPDGSPAQGNAVGRNSDTFGFYGVVWRLRSSMTLAWQRGTWSAAISARYFSSIVESCQAVTDASDIVGDPALRSLCSDPDHTEDGQSEPLNRVGAVTYFDLQAGWVGPWKGRFTLGLRNAFNRSPPVSYSAAANSFFPDYDIPGRYVYVSYRQAF